MKRCIFYDWCKTMVPDYNDSEVCECCWYERGYSGDFPYKKEIEK